MNFLKTIHSTEFPREVYCNGKYHLTLQGMKVIHYWKCCCNNPKEVRHHPMPNILPDDQRVSVDALTGSRWSGD